MCNSGDDRKLNRGAGHINSHGEVNGEVDAVKHPIGCGGPCVNAHGELYVPDSEEEEPDMKVEAAVYPGKTQQTDALPCKIRHCFGGIHGLKVGSGVDGEKVRGGIQSCKGFDVGKSCIRREGLRMDIHGSLCVPDSEEGDSDREVEASSADPAADRLAGMDGDNTAADRMELAAKKAAQIAAAMKLSPKVQARLESVLGNMDPLFHDEFVSMYKIMVPIFFKP